MPLYLNCARADIKSLKDLMQADRVAMPAIGSIQHVALQMQAEKELGDPKKLNRQIVAMSAIRGDEGSFRSSRPFDRSAWGRAQVREYLACQRDLYKHLHDPLRLMNRGWRPAEIAEAVDLPPGLAERWPIPATTAP